MSRAKRILCAFWVSGMVIACTDLDARYFKDRVNEVTMERVASRYGPPHKSERLGDDRTAWTYFERGSGTVGYSGFATGGICHVYTLTFDQQDVLREWKEHECRN